MRMLTDIDAIGKKGTPGICMTRLDYTIELPYSVVHLHVVLFVAADENRACDDEQKRDD